MDDKKELFLFINQTIPESNYGTFTCPYCYERVHFKLSGSAGHCDFCEAVFYCYDFSESANWKDIRHLQSEETMDYFVAYVEERGSQRAA